MDRYTDRYFMIHCDGDGDIYITAYDSKEKLNRELVDGKHKILDQIPEEINPMYWGDGVLIVKGEVVSPRPTQVVTEYEIP